MMIEIIKANSSNEIEHLIDFLKHSKNHKQATIFIATAILNKSIWQNITAHLSDDDLTQNITNDDGRQLVRIDFNFST